MFYIFFAVFLTSFREKNILPNLTNSQEPETFFFWPLGVGAEAARKKYTRSRSRSRSRLKKKTGAEAGAAKKLAGSPALLISLRMNVLSVFAALKYNCAKVLGIN